MIVLNTLWRNPRPIRIFFVGWTPPTDLFVDTAHYAFDDL